MTKFAKREKLWTNWHTFKNSKDKWYNEPFKNQEAEVIVKSVQKLAKENLEMKLAMGRDETDEVLEELNKDVKEAESHKVLIIALGSKAMRSRHWDKIYAVLDTQQPNPGENVTLDELIN